MAVSDLRPRRAGKPAGTYAPLVRMGTPAGGGGTSAAVIALSVVAAITLLAVIAALTIGIINLNDNDGQLEDGYDVINAICGGERNAAAAAALAHGTYGIAPSRLGVLEDLSADPTVVEVVLRAAVSAKNYLDDDVFVEVYLFNDLDPGPHLQVHLGQRVVVHYYNDLPLNTTVHWHGMETAAAMDGSNLSQPPVPPGGYYRYEFEPHAAGLFWYHSHIDTHVQVHRGLRGTVLVRDALQDAQAGMPGDGDTLVLSDLALNTSLPGHPVVDGWRGTDQPLARAEDILNGKEGQFLAVNGVTRGTGIVFHATEDTGTGGGWPMRLRVVNVANARFMRLWVDGMRIWRVGGDQGLLREPIELTPIVADADGVAVPDADGTSIDLESGLNLTPGERADLLLVPIAVLEKYPIWWYDQAKGRHRAFYADPLDPAESPIGLADAYDDGVRPRQWLAAIQPCGPVVPQPDWTPPAQLAPGPPAIDPDDVESTLVFKFGHAPPQPGAGSVVMFAQDIGKPFAAVTPDIAYTVAVGSVHRLRIINLTGMRHNVHLHGFAMQLERRQTVDDPGNTTQTWYPVGGAAGENKDSIILEGRPGEVVGESRTITDVLVRFDPGLRSAADVLAAGKVPTESTSGGWALHCHVLDHSGAGMFTYLQVEAGAK